MAGDILYSLFSCKSLSARFDTSPHQANASYLRSYLVFTDYGIYWIHRWEHHPICYRWLHKPHHKWIGELGLSLSFLRVTTYARATTVPTPFASHAFHPLDGYFQSLPYHIFIFIFPLHKKLYLVLFVLINFWTILVRLFHLHASS